MKTVGNVFLVRGCSLGDRASFLDLDHGLFAASHQKDIAYSFHIEAYYSLDVSFYTKIKESINQSIKDVECT